MACLTSSATSSGVASSYIASLASVKAESASVSEVSWHMVRASMYLSGMWLQTSMILLAAFPVPRFRIASTPSSLEPDISYQDRAASKS